MPTKLILTRRNRFKIKLIYKETILPEYGIPNPKISSRINKRLMKRKFIATIFMMLETFSVATVTISVAKHEKG